MANIHDYLLWRGDLTLEREPLQGVDALALSCLAYYSFHNILELQTHIPCSIEAAAKKAEKLSKEERRMRVPEDYELLQLMGTVPRFRDMELYYYVAHSDLDREEQFSAVTISLGDGSIFVSFRGTDSTLIGWKEDLNMTIMEQVPAQVSATEYLNHMAETHQGDIRVGGQSKGGNLAIYAAAHVPECTQNRILRVYNFDGPGFHESVIQSDGYQRVLPRIHSYVPQSSIIGRVMEHGCAYNIIYSTQFGIFQHNPYSWEIMRNDFVRLERQTEDSKRFNENLRYWMGKLSVEQREKLIDTVYLLLVKSPINEQGYIIFSPRGITEAMQSFRDESEEVTNILIKGFNVIMDALAGYKNSMIDKVVGIVKPEEINGENG